MAPTKSATKNGAQKTTGSKELPKASAMEAIKMAQDTRRAQKKARDRMSPKERALHDLEDMVNRIGRRIYRGYGSLGNFLRKPQNQKIIPREDMQRAVDYVQWCLDQAKLELESPEAGPPEFRM